MGKKVKACVGRKVKVCVGKHRFFFIVTIAIKIRYRYNVIIINANIFYVQYFIEKWPKYIFEFIYTCSRQVKYLSMKS